ncbi:glycoside hydrolase family 9 protein [uncultured Fibrobacter sp.]|uniref:glycoside hydrolase family 9 protein n=1 Tax=uncultured Fibrobacter sp. TaxID=261512 RepID=UPI00261FD533|nr:glycoside hydrolase family 9 protein [uncultured Fibrobacter sp.]
MMKYILKIALLFVFWAFDCALADDLPNIDRTDKVSSRRYLDSMNVYNRRVIRVNQVGFRPQDPKYAYVADPKEMTFKVIDANSGAEAWSGTLNLIDQNAPKPNIWVNGEFKAFTTLYNFGSKDSSTATEALYRADFSGLNPSTPGEYFVVVGKDTSATFNIHPAIFNAIFENSLKFFGIQRCGNTKSHMHAACHLNDGSAIGHDLTGGWHDCGDHFKPSETIGYAAYSMATTYLVYKNKAEDRFGNSYDDTIPDGYPDLLYEAKIGADYIYKLYKASKADGLIEKNDMYQTVGNQWDHEFWDVPEKQDAMPQTKGGPDRVVTAEVGSYSGAFAAALALFSVGWRDYEPGYADSLLEAAKDIYKNVTLPHSPAGTFGYTKATIPQDLYPGGSNESNMNDDVAAAALALWYATKDTMYQYQLYKDLTISNNSTNYMNNNEPNDAGPYFKGGFLGMISGFYPGGWMTDYENVHSYVLFSFVKLILSDKDTAKAYNVGELERDTLLQRATNSLRRLTDDGTQGKAIYENRFGAVKATPPYNLAWVSSDWGFNRYNMGAANAVFMLSEITTGAEHDAYLNLALDNIYYNMGANPWDISFLMGAGDKNSNHPHNRTANPDGYNAGGLPYEYRCPRGALMGGSAPTKTLLEDWSDWTATETCIDFSVQLLMPAQRLAEVLPPDNDGPLFSNIAGTPITETSAIVSWDANELALVTVFYNTTPDKVGAKSVQQEKVSKGGSLTLEDLEMGKTYYFFLHGRDVKGNETVDDNHGQWYQFTMTKVEPKVSGVTICQVDHRSAKIYWWTDIRSNGLIKYGTSMSALNETQASSDGTVLFHEVTLTNLKAGTTYYFTVSSGMTTDDNGGSGYSFTTESEASYVDLDISLKPIKKNSSCNSTGNWKDCNSFYFLVTNRDTVDYQDLEIRIYLDKPVTAVSYDKQPFSGTGLADYSVPFDLTVGTYTKDEDGNGYLPVTIKGALYVSGSVYFELYMQNSTYDGLENSWSLRAHVADDDPLPFAGIDLTRGPLYIEESFSKMFLETVNGVTEEAFRKDPYITAYYHGKHIYGYGPSHTAENGPQVHRKVTLLFEEPFKSPYNSVEKVDYVTTYQGSSSVSPTGFLDDFEMNGKPQNIIYDNGLHKDSFVFYKKDTVLAYGNNYMEWVSWHNHGANGKSENKYDCACAVVRTNVEIDTITVPLEKRYLVFDKQAYHAYQTKDPSMPRMVEVRVQLLDSNATRLDSVDLTLSLGTVEGNVLFWSSPTSTIPITSIMLVNGSATFYVSSEEVLTTTLFARAGSSTKFEYVPSEAVLVIEELPPWPIIDIAKMVDTDCDNKPDALKITISNEYQTNQSFNSVQFIYGTDTIKTTDVISQNAKEILVKANLTDSSINTNPSGSVTLYSNVGSKVESHTDFYQDGISPTILGVAVLERLDTATSDRVYMQFSEPISAPGTEWPVQLFASNKTTTVDAPVVKFTKLYNEAQNVWEFEIPFDADGSSRVTEGMFAQLLSTSSIMDKSGNGVSTECGQPKLPITLKLLPVPMKYAYIADRDEDGIAEFVYIEYERPIDQKHYPDSISIEFGLTEPETLWVSGSVPEYADDGMSASLKLPVPFRYGVTVGSYESMFDNVVSQGAGLVAQHIGSAASYETNSTYAEDKVGPVIVSAVLNTSNSDNFDMLTIEFSEVLNMKDSSLVLYREKLGSRDTAIYRHSLKSSNFTSDRLVAFYGKDSELGVSDGDYVRMQPKDFSAYIDKQGNLPSQDNPWVPITGSGAAEIKFSVKLENQIAEVGSGNRSMVQSTSGIRLYVVNPKTQKLDMIVHGQVVTQGIDTALIQGAIWKMELTVPRGASASEVAAWDTLVVKYDIPIYSNLGSYVNRASGSFDVLPTEYFSTDGKVIFYVEWANTEFGIQSEQGRAVATGAYIYKAQLDCRFVPNANYDAETQDRFSGKNSYDKTETFGIKRVK